MVSKNLSRFYSAICLITILLFVRLYTLRLTYSSSEISFGEAYLADSILGILGLFSALIIFVSMLYFCFSNKPIKKKWLLFMLLLPVFSSMLYFYFFVRRRDGAENK